MLASALALRRLRREHEKWIRKKTQNFGTGVIPTQLRFRSPVKGEINPNWLLLRQRTLELNAQNQKLKGSLREQRQRFEKVRATYLQLKERWQQRRRLANPSLSHVHFAKSGVAAAAANLAPTEPVEAQEACLPTLPQARETPAKVESGAALPELKPNPVDLNMPATGST